MINRNLILNDAGQKIPLWMMNANYKLRLVSMSASWLDTGCIIYIYIKALQCFDRDVNVTCPAVWGMSNKGPFHNTGHTLGCNCAGVCDCVTDLLSSGTLLPRTQLSCSGTDSGVVCSSAGRAAGGAGLTFLRQLRELWFSAVTDGCCLCRGGTGGSVDCPCWCWLDGCSVERIKQSWVNQWWVTLCRCKQLSLVINRGT